MDSLSVKRFLLFFLLLSGCLSAQVRDFALANANCQLFGNTVFVYGLQNEEKGFSVSIRRFDTTLKQIDSLILPQKGKADDYLQTWSDTLHGFLNIYLQKKENKSVTIFRFNRKQELVATVENVDVARLNSVSGFEGGRCYYKNSFYSIRTVPDSGGKQFFIDKYILKDELKNFEYAMSWQFPFERKYIRSARIFYADRKQVLVFVHLEGPGKRSQWVLKIHATTGELTRGIKLNEPEDLDVYEFGNFLVDTVKKTLLIAGQKFKAAQWKEDTRQPSIANATQAHLYLISIDSLAEIDGRDEFKIPVKDIRSGVDKSASSYLLRLTTLKKKEEGVLSLGTDVYRSRDGMKSFFYVNSGMLTVRIAEEEVTLDKTEISPQPMVEKFYFVPDPLDLNGRLFTDTSSRFEALYEVNPTLPVKLAYKQDGLGNGTWLLKKSYAKKGNLSYALLSPVNRIYKITAIAELSKVIDPVFLPISLSRYLIATQTEGNYQVKIAGW